MNNWKIDVIGRSEMKIYRLRFARGGYSTQRLQFGPPRCGKERQRLTYTFVLTLLKFRRTKIETFKHKWKHADKFASSIVSLHWTQSNFTAKPFRRRARAQLCDWRRDQRSWVSPLHLGHLCRALTENSLIGLGTGP
ncbi:hypothetical protein AAFF_G00138180 [Aldrovandia affinis]|uniref:Uncharacterized protein n=1 Tax=Aldrovandia affinis TaxID=143900 RepID=A0AAD7X3Q6_9TELE|nr:hypothetical protein AAFF_G00138180 [Aldrovandia affinis]